MSDFSCKSTLRSKLQQARQNIPEDSKRLASIAILNHVKNSELINHSNVGLYWSCNNEISTKALLAYLMLLQKNCYLPKVLANNNLEFAALKLDNIKLINNKYNIPEPSNTNIINLAKLDIVFLPLVGFDNTGNRLGMGGGYYDRALADIKKNQYPTKIVGLGYEAQCVEKIPSDVWDIKLDIVITPEKIRYIS